MGNCVQSSSSSSCSYGASEDRLVQLQRRRGTSGGEGEEDQQGAPSPPVVKMKIVLTKGELAELVARLKGGDRRLEDVLHEMACRREGRASGDGWRPSLESIVECPVETAAASCDD
ncbi:uncharacterized protein LOC133917443 [Phragmites australis]|uniref:uncharacterized protein LOC133917443 n=1 Tax=Phragmites australis TaxID=29695 RepID=UPI002D7797FC|nr:uncharacterized protein LOC133917443 [Phragmites australis]